MGLYDTLTSIFGRGPSVDQVDSVNLDDRHAWEKPVGKHIRKGEGAVTLSSVDALPVLKEGYSNTAVNASGATKTYDPVFLRELAKLTIAQAIIDTLSQDVGATPWRVIPEGGEDVGEQKMHEIERRVENLHPELSWSQLIDKTVTTLLETGDAPWIKARKGGDFVGVVVPDTASMYKVTGDAGVTTDYLQVSRGHGFNSRSLDKDDVAWFQWGVRSDGPYGYGPTEKAQPVLEVLQELIRKEITDLREGSQSGILSRVKDDEFNPTSEEYFKKLQTQLNLEDEQRHVTSVESGEWQFTPLNPAYSEQLLIDRNHWWTQVLSSAYKVSPSYAGIAPEQTNRATDASQREAYKQKGFRVTLSLIEDVLNSNIMNEFDAPVRFEFIREQSVSEQMERAEYYEQVGRSAQTLSAQGLDVRVRDGQLILEDGEVDGDMSRSAEQSFKETPRVAEKSAGVGSMVDEWSSRVVRGVDAPLGVPQEVRETVDTAVSTLGVHDEVAGVLKEAISNNETLSDARETLSYEFPALDRDEAEVLLKEALVGVVETARKEVGLSTGDVALPESISSARDALEQDFQRTPRQREVERAFGKPLPQVLTQLEAEAGTRTGVVARLADHEDIEGAIDRTTLYRWLDDANLK